MSNKTERYNKAVNIFDVMENSSFADIIKKLSIIDETNRKLTALLPQSLKYHVRFGQIQEGVLMIEVANAMVRQSILFQQETLLPQMQQLYPEIKQIKVTINPEFSL